MKAYIYTGGAILPQNITERPGKEDLVIAADSGYRNAIALGASPSIVLGDFDSLGEITLPEGVERLTVPSEKDFTDTQLAVDTALKQGADDLVIIGGLSGRLDHTLSNLSILEDLSEKRVHAVITDGFNRVRYLHATSTLLARSSFPYFGLLALTEKVKGVDIEGAKYPLKNATVKRSFQFAVSNEITGNCALIALRKGGVYIVESTDTPKK